MKSFWDSRYAEAEYVYGTAPNIFFETTLRAVKKKGKILIPADGEGRNAVFAASLGWAVTAFDYSPPAKLKALQLAEQRGVQINYQTNDIQGFKFERETYDIVLLCYVHLQPPLRKLLHQQAMMTLKKDGLLIFEGFAKEQLQYTSGGPKNPEMLFTKEILEADFSELTIQLLEQKLIILEEGRYHVGPAQVMRLTATK